jgi:ribosomal protein S18 acetylase RimI-like enzyme
MAGKMSIETFEKNGLIFRPATEKDLAKILAFTDIFLRKDYFLRRPELKEKQRIGSMLVVLDGDKLVAWAAMGKNGALWNLLVHSKYRGRHIGETIVKELNPPLIRSKRDQSTGDPLAFYQKIGYRIVQVRQGRKRNIDILEKI